MKYKYYTSVFSVEYQKNMGKGFLDKYVEYDPCWPEWRSLPDDSKYKRHMDEMGESGWELVSVQPILRGVYNNTSSNISYGYSITAGYYFFWKKAIDE